MTPLGNFTEHQYFNLSAKAQNSIVKRKVFIEVVLVQSLAWDVLSPM